MGKRITIALAIFALMVPALYVGGYFLLGERKDWSDTTTVCRQYPQEWMAQVVKPLARTEAKVIGKRIVIIGPDWECGEGFDP